MRHFLGFVLGSLLFAGTAQADVIASVSIKDQTLTLYQNGIKKHVWPVSTARRGKVTPKGE